MAREKAKKTVLSGEGEDGKELSMLDITDLFNEDMGEGFMLMEGSDATMCPRLSSGFPDLDEALGGGYPRGKVIEIYGEPSTGKTWLFSKICAANNCRAMIYDLEDAYNVEFARKSGVDLKKVIIKQPDSKLSAEVIFDQIEKICISGMIDVICVDSVSNMIPKDDLEGGMEDLTMASLARVMSRGLKKVVYAAASSGTTLIFINQIREKVGTFSMYGVVKDTPGGKALKFQASVRVETSKKMGNKSEFPELYNDQDEPIAHILKCKVVKNKTAPPHKECEILLRYEPIPKHQEIVENAIKLGIISKNKSNHKKMEYKNFKFEIAEKSNYQQVWDIMRENKFIIQIIFALGKEDLIEEFITTGILEQKELDSFLGEKKTKNDTVS